MSLENTIELRVGKGRTRVTISARFTGEDLVVLFYNEKGHIGAVAVADYDHKGQRASVSIITRLGHKEDIVAHNAAHLLCKQTKKAVCVIAGIHLDNITEMEKQQIVENSNKLVTNLIVKLSPSVNHCNL
jgi:gallate decarboxylase subunit D